MMKLRQNSVKQITKEYFWGSELHEMNIFSATTCQAPRPKVLIVMLIFFHRMPWPNNNGNEQ